MSLRRTFAAVAATALVACGHDPSSPLGSQHPALTALPRALTPSEQSVLEASNAYSFALWRTINSTSHDSNVFVSPLSVSFALGMALNGANGPTYDEMRSALQFGGAPLTSIDSGYKSLIGLLSSLDPSTTMKIANGIFYRSGFPFNQSFLNDAAKWFDAEVKPQNFDDVAATVNAVNGWASSKTNGKIPKVIDDYDQSMVMFLLNAIYFKGSWRDKFDPANTRAEAFHAVSGDQSKPLMHRQGKMSYAETATFQAVDLPYGDSAFTMSVILPKPDNSVESVAASLTPDAWHALGASYHNQLVDLTLPKVTLTWKRNLIPDMKALGMKLAFTDLADFTRMSSGQQLLISLLQQNTFVAIDEEGTEAAAVTTVGVTVTSVPQVTTMRVDRPFIFVIRERLSGSVLFMGKIVQLP
ncbi:MAG TPA: serpin family protein [Gemmatimonadaceae bacterium]|nr:serpin family protein [Gemmatimonadaceae bacterium]